MKCSDLHCMTGLLLPCLFLNTLPQLCCRLISKCNRCDLRRTDFSVFQEIVKSGYKRLCLSRAGACLYRNMRRRTPDSIFLFRVQTNCPIPLLTLLLLLLFLQVSFLLRRWFHMLLFRFSCLSACFFCIFFSAFLRS